MSLLLSRSAVQLLARAAAPAAARTPSVASRSVGLLADAAGLGSYTAATAARCISSSSVALAPPPRSGGGGGPSGARASPGSSAKAAAADPAKSIIANDRIRVAEVRVIEEGPNGRGNSLGVMPTSRALALAKEKGRDLVLLVPDASPPVAKIMALHALVAEKRQAATDAKRRERQAQLKEMHYTSRITDHDLDVKTRRVHDFLKDGRATKVIVSFAMNAWAREEPARREVMTKIIRRVVEDGVGFPDVNSLRGEGPKLSVTLVPTATPKPVSELSKILTLLAAPMRPGGSDDRTVHLEATVKATGAGAGGSDAAAGAAAAAPPPPGPRPGLQRAVADAALPTPETLARLKKGLGAARRPAAVGHNGAGARSLPLPSADAPDDPLPTDDDDAIGRRAGPAPHTPLSKSAGGGAVGRARSRPGGARGSAPPRAAGALSDDE